MWFYEVFTYPSKDTIELKGKKWNSISMVIQPGNRILELTDVSGMQASYELYKFLSQEEKEIKKLQSVQNEIVSLEKRLSELKSQQK